MTPLANAACRCLRFMFMMRGCELRRPAHRLHFIANRLQRVRAVHLGTIHDARGGEALVAAWRRHLGDDDAQSALLREARSAGKLSSELCA